MNIPLLKTKSFNLKEMADYGFTCSETVQILIILNIYPHIVYQTTILTSQVYQISY